MCAEAAQVRIGVLGPLQVDVGPARLDLTARRQRAVIAMLGLRAGRPVPVGQLVDGLWGEEPPESAVRTLHSYVAHVRRALADHGARGVLLTREPGYLVDLPSDAVDALQFADLARAGRARLAAGDLRGALAELEAGLGLWRGDELADCGVAGWAAAEGARLAQARLSVAEDVLALRVALGDHRTAVEELEYRVRELPLRERLWELLVAALYGAGRQGDALAAYQRARSVLVAELGVDPGPGLVSIEQLVLRGEPLLPESVLPDLAVAGRSGAPEHRTAAETAVQPGPEADPAVADRPPNGIPAPLTRMIGRHEETELVHSLVQQHRLVTLRGVGGAGKTRLAIAVCDRIAAEGGLEPYFVDLAPLADPAVVPQTVAHALGVPAAGHQRVTDALRDHIGGRPLLVVLDNCEHLVEACAWLADALLRGCPELHVLATSREALDCDGETVWAVPPLAVPDADAVQTASDLAGYPGVDLFLDRAEIGPAHALTPAQARALATICASLDGLPLALELAAARARVLALPQIAARLHDRFGLLTRGTRTARPHQRTLRETVGWSYDLLPPVEQELFRRLSVFAGTFDLAEVAAVWSDDPSADATVLEPLGRLADKSLVLVQPGPDGARYRLLETLRVYAAEQLDAEPDERDQARDRLARYLTRLAEDLAGHLHGEELQGTVDRLAAEHDNLRAAVSWLLPREAETALRLATALCRYSYLRGHYREGRGWLDAALAAASDAPSALRATAMAGAAALAAYECDYDGAKRLATEALGFFRTLDDRHGTARSLNLLGSVAREQGDYARCGELHSEALEAFSELGDRWGAGHAMQMLGLAAWLSGDFAGATIWSTRSLTVFEELGDKERIAWATTDLGAVALYAGDVTTADQRLRAALDLFADVRFKEGIAWAQDLLGRLDIVAAAHGSALDRLRHSLRLHHEMGDRWRYASVLEALAHVAVQLGAVGTAAELVGLARSVRATLHAPVPPAERPQHDATWAALVVALDEAAVQTRLSRGTRLSYDDVCARVDAVRSSLAHGEPAPVG